MTTEAMMTYCPCCTHLYSKRAPKCPKCNWPRTATCNICNTQIPYQSRSCPECGDPDPFSGDSHAQEANALPSGAVKNAIVNMKIGQKSEIGDSTYEYSPSEINKGPKGVKGWLLFLVIQMTLIGPVWEGMMTLGAFSLTEEKYPYLTHWDQWTTYKILLWIAFGIIAVINFVGGWKLVKVHEWTSVRTAIAIFAIAGPVAHLVCAYLIPYICFGKVENEPSRIIGQLIVVLIPLVVWIPYLLMSKRVRNTYDKDIEDNENTPRSSEYNGEASDTDIDGDKNPRPLLTKQRPEHWEF